MAVGKGAPAAVLTGDSDPIAVLKNGGISQRFGAAPVDRFVAPYHGAAILKNFLHAGVRDQSVGNFGGFVAQAEQFLSGYRGVAGRGPVNVEIGFPVNQQYGLLVTQFAQSNGK